MTDAVVVSTARTPIGKAFRGAFNQTHGAVLTGHAIKHAVARAGVEPAEVEDVIIGCGLPEGATGHNVARQAALLGGLPVETSATTVNRFCSSGLQTISMAAQRVVMDQVPVMVAGGVGAIRREHIDKKPLPVGVGRAVFLAEDIFAPFRIGMIGQGHFQLVREGEPIAFQ